jgi:ATP-binding cassette subfamily F protein 3
MPSNLLLLDEPTNHLDIPAREALEAFLRETTATILLVSHDRRLLETVCDRLWVVDEGRIVPFEAGYRSWRAAAADGWRAGAAYLREVERFHGRGSGGGTLGGARPAAGRGASAPAGTAAALSPSSAPTQPAAARSPRQTKLSKDAYRRQKAVIEDDMGRLGMRKSHLELALMNPTTAANFVELRRVTSELADVDQALAAAEEAWLLLEERAP